MSPKSFLLLFFKKEGLVFAALNRLRRATRSAPAAVPRRTATTAPDYFNALYATDPDPWHFTTSAYEQAKYAATLAALPDRRFAAGLEVGCSIGVFTEVLATRCNRLLGIDVADAALVQARLRCPQVCFERRMVPGEFPGGTFDLIVFSEVLYYLDAADLAATAALAAAALGPHGTILLVNYLGETDCPLTGDDAAQTFIAASGLALTLQSREATFRIDRLGHAEAPAG